ncbi:MAG: histidine kinase [Calditrichaeota bacterium]|nr:histidine kinase [Calditrichota bacterium]
MSKQIVHHHDKSPVQHALGIGFYAIVSYLMAIVYNYVVSGRLATIYFFELFLICISISASIYSINTFFISDDFINWKPFKRASFLLIDVLISTVIGLIIAQILIELLSNKNLFYLADADTYIGCFIISIIISTVAFVYYVLQARIIDAQETIHQAEKEKMQLAKLKAEMELELLQGKLNPHFLFNSLNSVAGLIRIDPPAAEKMILELADLFRALIDSDLRTMHSIGDEFALLESYLKIEKIRFGERLNYEIESHCDTNLQIPKLIMQPLVENSIRYVIAKNKIQGIIRIAVKASDQKLFLSVADSGPGFEVNQTNGYGLKHIRERLALIYNKKAVIKSEKTDLFVITIVIPISQNGEL